MYLYFLRRLSLLLALLLFCQGAFASEEQGWRLRLFLSRLILATEPNDSPAKQAQNARAALVEFSDLIPIVLDQSSVRELVADAQLTGAVEAVKNENRFAKVLQETIEVNLEKWFRTWSGVPVSSTELTKFLTEQIGAHPEVIKLAPQALQAGAQAFDRATPETRLALLQLLPDSMVSVVSEKLNEEIAKAKISSSPALRRLADQGDQVPASGLGEKETKALKRALLDYFDNLSVKTKRSILVAWLSQAPSAPMEAQLATVLNQAGPVLQKIFQLLGRDSPDPQVKAVMRELLANVAPFPTSDAVDIIEQETQKPFTQIFATFQEPPLAAGTIGQVYRAQLRSSRQWVVVKVLRPGIDIQMRDEFRIFRMLVKDYPLALQLLSRMEENFSAELDFRTEARHLEEMKVYRNKKLGINTPDLIAEFPPTRRVLFMEMAEGTPLSKLKLDPEIKGQAIYNVIKRWFDEVMYGSGYFHGDMHPGNLLLALEPGQRPPFQITVIDPGSSGMLPIEARRGFIRFKLAVLSNDIEATVDSLAAFGKVPEGRRKELSQAVEKIFLETAGSDPTNKVLTMSLRNGLEIDPNIVMFSRAILFLERELQNVNAEILAKNPGAKIFHAENAYILMTLKHLGKEWPQQLVGMDGDEAVVETEELLRFFRAKIKQKATEALQECSGFYKSLFPARLAP